VCIRGTKESSGGKADILGERVWSDDDPRGSTDPLDMIGEGCENLCADDVVANLCANDVVTPTPLEEETKEATPDPQIKTSNDKDGFMEYLVAYITAILISVAIDGAPSLVPTRPTGGGINFSNPRHPLISVV
jgi:hypothetical protein